MMYFLIVYSVIILLYIKNPIARIIMTIYLYNYAICAILYIRPLSIYI